MARKFSESSLEIYVLGRFRAAIDGVPVPGHRWLRRKAKVLVQLLALEPRHQIHREQIIELFWPDYSPEAAANNLYKTIYFVRRALEPGLSSHAASNFLTAKENKVVLHASGQLWIDADEFERRALAAMRQGGLEDCKSALRLYGGELLAEESYEQWFAARREHLRILHRKLVVKLAQLSERTGQHEQSIERLNGLIETDPTDEHAHRQLMRLYALTGSKFQALAQYKQCCAALRCELDADPEFETSELARQIIKGIIKPAPLKTIQPSSPVFQKLTFRHGTIRSAKMSDDCKLIVYSAAWEDHPFELYAIDCESRGTEALGIKEAGVLAIGPSKDLAISLRRRSVEQFVTSGTLAHYVIAGRDIQELAEGVQWADWSREKKLLVVRDGENFNRLEFPIGSVLYETTGWISHPRISPRGDSIAFINHPIHEDDGGSIAVVGLEGRIMTLSEGWLSAQGLAWYGEEIWFTATKAGNARALHAVTLSGHTRLINRAAGCLTLHDISSDGRLLMSHDNSWTEMQGRAPNEETERNLSWFDWSIAGDLSDDGKTLLFTEAGEASGSQYGVYLRGTNGSPAVRLGNGFALALSRHQEWALALTQTTESQLMLLPVGSLNKSKVLSCGATHCQPWAAVLPDDKRILFVGNEQGRGSRLYLQRIDGGSPRPITPEGVRIFSSHAIAPNGKLIAGTGPDRLAYLYDLKTDEPAPVPGVIPGEVPIQWNSDGSSIFVFCRGQVPAKIYEINIANAERTYRKQLLPTDGTGVHEIVRVLVTPTLSSYVFTYMRDFSELYLVEGLK